MRLEDTVRVVAGRGDVVDDRLEQRFQVVVGRRGAVRRALDRRGTHAGRRVDDRHVQDEVEVQVGHLVGEVGGESEEQVHRLTDDLLDAGVRPVRLVDQEDDGKLGREGLAEHEARLGRRALGRIDEQDDAVDHGQPALHLAAEVGVARGVDDVDGDGLALGRGAVVEHRGVLREDGDALLALEVARVHDAVGHVAVGRERIGLLQHGVDQGGFSVVNVGHDGYVAEIGADSGVACGFRHA